MSTRPLDPRLPLSPLALWDAELPNAVIGGNLELGEMLGEGGMGAVFKARDLRLERTVAVKFLPPSLAASAEFRARFDREAKALARLNHPNIVTVYDFGFSDGQSYIVMEFVEGQPLSRLLPLPVGRALEIAAQVCDALAYAHSQGVVHRDIKPDNILINERGWVKVADFGIARVVGERGAGWTVTTPDMAVGTPYYMAPEMTAGSRPDPRMDVYAVGVLLFRAITDRFPAGDLEELPTDLRPVVRKALSSDPAARYADGAELRRALPLATQTSLAHHGLPPDQLSWLRAVALVQTLATAMALWAIWLCVTPRVIQPDEVRPLVMLTYETLADGRLVSRARFEIWPVLMAVAATVAGITAYGLLRRHWRIHGYERHEPERILPEARRVLWLGGVALGSYALHLTWLTDYDLFNIFMPILGGVWELVTLWTFWVGILELWRHHRSLRREWRLWFGIGVAWIPPFADLARYLLRWQP